MNSAGDPQLEELITELDLEKIDLILVEGFRHVSFPKIELHRSSLNKDLIFANDSNVIAVVSDEVIDTGRLPRLDINQPDDLVQFIR